MFTKNISIKDLKKKGKIKNAFIIISLTILAVELISLCKLWL